MKKQQRTVGSILEVDLCDGTFVYAQILEKASFAFFDYRVKSRLSNFDILTTKGILFILSVYKNAVTDGRWLKVGKIPIVKELQVLPMQFIQDALNPIMFSLYNPNTGEITDTTKDKVLGLEAAAVWEAEHVESRVKDYYNATTNIWVEQLKIK